MIFRNLVRIFRNTVDFFFEFQLTIFETRIKISIEIVQFPNENLEFLIQNL